MRRNTNNPLTRHGEHRMRKRLGLPKKTVEKQAALAIDHGQRPAEFTGQYRKYLDRMGKEYRTTPITYKGNIYIFAADGALITAFPISAKYRKLVKAHDDKQVN